MRIKLPTNGSVIAKRRAPTHRPTQTHRNAKAYTRKGRQRFRFDN